jgi:alkylation response protein AidB-like acyl-CoA dehydrogenase
MTPGSPVNLSALSSNSDCIGRRLDARLAELAVDGGPFDPAELVALDRAEAFPVRACRALDELGVPSYYVPERFGGALRDYSDVLFIWRALARRDLTVAIAHGKTFLGAISCWVAGHPEQGAMLGAQVARGAVVAWGLTERGHGSDLLAGELTAASGEGCYRLRGEKWLINNATRARFITVLARTAVGGGPRGLSLIVVDKERLPTGAFECLPKELTHGIRGADISGVAFHDAEIGTEARIGPCGAGLEIVLSALQITRTLCAGLSLGALDHALQLAVAFARTRRLYDRQLIELPHARTLLASACAARFVAEAVAFVGTRSLHSLTEESSLTSAIVKALVPALADETIAALGDLLGARAFLCDVFEHGRFEKLVRDHRIVPIFDGTTAVNRHQIVSHFSALAREGSTALDESTIATAAALRSPLPALDPLRLRVRARTCSLIRALPGLVSRVQRDAESDLVPDALAELARFLLEVARDLRARILECAVPERHPDAAGFALAEQFEVCWAGAACLAVYERNRSTELARNPLLWRGALWVQAALTWILARSGSKPANAFDELASLLESGRSEAELTLFPELRAEWHGVC